jgi:hypothetical protein
MGADLWFVNIPYKMFALTIDYEMKSLERRGTLKFFG